MISPARANIYGVPKTPTEEENLAREKEDLTEKMKKSLRESLNNTALETVEV